MPTEVPPIPGVPASALLPVVETQLHTLAALPPGPEAQSKLAEILALIKAMLENPAINALLPLGWKLYVTAAIAGISLLLGGGILGRVTAPNVPAPIVAPVTPPVTPPVDVPIPIPAPIKPPVVNPNKVVIYRTSPEPIGTSAGVFVDPKIYEAGSTYPFAGKSIPLPVMALIGPTGTVLDVQPFVNAADAAALLKGKK